MRDVYNENDKILLKEIKENLNTLEGILCSCIRRLNVIKIAVLFTQST